MKRQALIIECSAVTGQSKLPGAVVDAAAWKKYLSSTRGGAWESGEIQTLSNPTPALILSRVAAMSGDYGLIAFSGHGCVVADTTMVAAEGGLVSEQQLVTNPCVRLTLILDSCRGVESPTELAKSEVMLDSVEDRSAYRRAFEDAVLRSEKGTCRLYGCDFNEGSGEDPKGRGGFFTQALIAVGRRATGKGVLGLDKAFEVAAADVRSKDPRQNPQASLGRRMHQFPFAVLV